MIVRFSPDGKRIFTCGRDDGDVKSWDAATGKPLGLFHADDRPLENMAISPDGTILAIVSQSEVATLWHVGRHPPGQALSAWRRGAGRRLLE